MQPSQLPSQQQSGAAKKPEPTPTAGGKAKAIVGQTEGFAAQEALLAPKESAPPIQGGPGAPQAPQTVAKEEGAKAENKAPIAEGKTDVEQKGIPKEQTEAGEQLSPIRAELLKQFELLEGKGIGMKEFDSVCSEATWKKFKEKERVAKEAAEKKYTEDMAKYQALPDDVRKKTPKPVKAYVPVYTTCIDTMGLIAKTAWKASGLAVKRVDGQKYDEFAFGSDSRKKATSIGAWVEASPGSGQAPKTGDMIMLEKAGPKLDKLAEEGRGLDLNAGAKEKKLKKELANLEAASQSANAAFAASSKAKAVDVQAALAKVKADLDQAKTKLSTKLAEAQAGLAEKVKGGMKLEFSHVGFFKGRTEELGPDGKPTGREVWTTFDGGQSQIAGAVDGQGAKAGKRYYDPKTNLITGEASQGGAVRWLAGWVDVDKMAKQSEPQ